MNKEILTTILVASLAFVIGRILYEEAWPFVKGMITMDKDETTNIVGTKEV